MAAERRFRAMGTEVLLVADGDEEDLDAAVALVHSLEARWSRFRPGSELMRLNRARGPVVVSAPTFELLTLAVEGWRRTAGRFDPTVLAALVELGYDRSFELVAPVRGDVTRDGEHAPGCRDVVLDDDLRLVIRPADVTFDLGGIAKGHTADLVVDLLRRRGAQSALADIGGDVRVGGGSAWAITIAHPFDDERDLGAIALVDGAVVTTSRLRRRWGANHHVVDPLTGRSADAGLAAITVVAATAAEAEVVAKAAFVAGKAHAAEVIEAHGATGVLVFDDATSVRLPRLHEYAA